MRFFGVFLHRLALLVNDHENINDCYYFYPCFPWFLFAATIFSLGHCHESLSAGCIESEREALLQFKFGLKDPSNQLSSWGGDANCCGWSRVICDNLTSHVIELHLRSLSEEEYYASNHTGFYDDYWDSSTFRGFGGLIPHQLGNLSNLQYLTISSYDYEKYVVPNAICGGKACTFNMTYGSSSIAANLSQDNITLATDSVPGYTFGCITKATGSSVRPQGLLGLGRGPLSLLSQSQKLYKSTFSYCLPSFRSLSFSGSLRLGPIGQPKRIKTTPLLKNPRRSSLYYVNLVAIRVGRRVVDIPPSALAFNPTTGAGTIFDFGTVFTRLVTPAYTAVRMHSESESAMQRTAGSITCLAMAAAPDNVNSVLNVIANMQQQNHRILYDVPNSRIGVARER
ncbi:hypothetical protein GH714_017480 [Hevea brasiliensis]|uniref:Leucine-rich repeat-containing N-terminal plant-type domain-containing protein n=1 Tax=Hevea brasiliensis TaxID=3981 RepID=A0A6A6NC86_HEVBR|nr:hypothetical protein GH714_017480 [Hevea brasiliensis]